MTMIAGFKIDETPFLIGDFVISINDSGTGERRRHKVKKKAVILSRNCAVAWMGSAHTAKEVLDDLFERFRNVEVKKEDIEGFLTSREPTSEFLEVRLIIWFVDAEKTLFMWCSSEPSMKFEYDPIVAGSGGESFESIQNRLQDIRNPQLGVNENLGKAMMYYSELMTLEIKEPDPTFGFAYEIVSFVDGRFAYFSKLLYCDIHADCTEDSDIQTTYAKLFGSFVYDYEGEPNVTCLTWLDIFKNDAEMMLVTPPGRRPWIKEAEDHWAARVHENANEIMCNLLESIVLYCVRITLRVGERTLRPAHFIYDCLSKDKLDRDNAVMIDLSVSDRVNIYMNYGKNLKNFMIDRG